MRKSVLHKLACGALLVMLTAPVLAAPDTFKDPLDVQATMLKRRLDSTHTNAITQAGNRLVAVGIGGLVVYSDDGGKKWLQGSVPVSSDLTDVYFPTADTGWAVGQDGVVLRTRDAGQSWEKQLDGRMTKKLLTDHFEALASGGNPDAQKYLQDVQLNYEGGPEQVLLSVWFKNEQQGFVSGSFGTLLATDDGGATWTSWVEKVEAETPPHFYGIRGTRFGVMMVSEQGVVFRLDPDKERFVPMQTGYNGTFFSLLETKDSVFALGLRGNAYRLKPETMNWEKMETGASGSITSGAQLADGSVLLATQMGQLLMTRDDGASFHKVQVAQPMSFTGIVAVGPNTTEPSTTKTSAIAASGLSGVRAMTLP
ncbi:MAG TPA: YCF48-related protein [Dongiaceae bacterium]|nr:YCF48-related protein [Dongiaceae bacterium]